MTLACVLDASALLALLQTEPGSDAVLSRIKHGACCISAVNVTRVLTRLIDRGMRGKMPKPHSTRLNWRCRHSTMPRRVPAPHCVRHRAAVGLSIGDRAYLALARSQQMPALTEGRAWAQLDCGVIIEQIRPGV